MFNGLRNYRLLKPIKFTSGTEISKLINSIAALQKSSKYYLEIGVEYGRTFENVKIKKKIAVDPKFRFVANKIFNRNSTFFEMESDKFFSKYQEKIFFDVVFLDGLHTSEQTYKDFLNLFPYLHSRSVVIIDDSVPSDQYSILPSAEETYLARKKDGVENDFTWHGDVFRCICKINKNFPNLISATISDLNNPVTIFFGFQNLNIEAIPNSDCKCTYFDKGSIPSHFNPIEEIKFLNNLETYLNKIPIAIDSSKL